MSSRGGRAGRGSWAVRTQQFVESLKVQIYVSRSYQWLQYWHYHEHCRKENVDPLIWIMNSCPWSVTRKSELSGEPSLSQKNYGSKVTFSPALLYFPNGHFVQKHSSIHTQTQTSREGETEPRGNPPTTTQSTGPAQSTAPIPCFL